MVGETNEITGGTVSVGGGATPMRRVEKAALFVVLLSEAFEIVRSNRVVFPAAAAFGLSGTPKASDPSGAIEIFFVQVTVELVPPMTVAPQPHHEIVEAVSGPSIRSHEKLSTVVMIPTDPVFPTFVTVIGRSDSTPTCIGVEGAPIPGMRSGTSVET